MILRQVLPIDIVIVLVKVAFILAAGLVASRLLQGQSAALRHRVLACAVAGSLAVPVLSALLPGWHSTALSTVLPAARELHRGPMQQEEPPLSSMLVRAEGKFPVNEAVLAIWMTGAIVLLARLAAATGFRFRNNCLLLDEACMRLVIDLSPTFRVRRPVRLLLSGCIDAMPVTWGTFYPRILLPADAMSWPDERRRVVLSHELAHIGRRDWAWQILAETVAAVFWFLPLSCAAATLLRREGELAADDAVLNSGIKPSFYATELLALSRTLTDSRHFHQGALAMAKTSHLERRFSNMLNTNTNRRRLSRTIAFSIAIAAISIMLPLAAIRLPAQQRSGRFTGAISDTRNGVIPNATIIMSNTAAGTKDMTTSDAVGQFAFSGLPAGQYEMQVLQPGFQTLVVPGVELRAGIDARNDAILVLGPLNERIEVFGGTSHGTNHNEAVASGAPPTRIRVGGNVQAANLIRQVKPPYPPAARAAGIQGAVLLQAEIGQDGSLNALRVLSSQIDPDLARAAVEAVQQWRYKPTLLNGQPVEVVTNVTVNFTLEP